MENGTDALKMAAAVLVFVLAISIAIYALTNANKTATAVLAKSDSDSEYYDMSDTIKITDVSGNRIVGIETVIPTLYSYYKEGYTILFYKGRLDVDNKLDGPITPLTLYYSEAQPTKLAKSRLRNEDDPNNFKANVSVAEQCNRAIYGFDLDDESTREEPWIGTETIDREFMKCFINNIKPDLLNSSIPSYYRSNQYYGNAPNTWGSDGNNQKYFQMNFDTNSNNGLVDALGEDSLSKASNARFLERVGIYNMVPVVEESSSPDSTHKVNTVIDSSIDEFSNGETAENEEGTQKRVIQYILIK